MLAINSIYRQTCFVAAVVAAAAAAAAADAAAGHPSSDDAHSLPHKPVHRNIASGGPGFSDARGNPPIIGGCFRKLQKIKSKKIIKIWPLPESNLKY